MHLRNEHIKMSKAKKGLKVTATWIRKNRQEKKIISHTMYVEACRRCQRPNILKGCNAMHVESVERVYVNSKNKE